MSSANGYHVLARLIAAAVNVSQKSARILRDVKKSGELNIQEKELNDYVTKADFLSQLNIIKSLEKMFPKISFRGEEGDLKEEYTDLETTYNEDVLKNAKSLPDIYNTLKEEDLLIWVDPLDGTKEYTQGYDVAKEVTVLIGVTWKDRPIAGVVNQPFYNISKDQNTIIGRVLWGIVGLGVFDLERGALPVPKSDSSAKLRIATTRSHMDGHIGRDLNAIPNSELIQCGGAGFKALTVLDGVSDCYLYPKNGTKRWDTCAPEALVRCLNGQMTDVFGKEYSYNLKDGDIVENCYGILFSLRKDNSDILKYISDDLKAHILSEVEKLKAKYSKI